MIFPRVGWVRADQVPSSATFDAFASLSQENKDLRIELEKTKNKDQTNLLVDTLKAIEIKVPYNEHMDTIAADILVTCYTTLLTGESEYVLMNLINSEHGVIFSDLEALRKKIENIFSIFSLHNIVNASWNSNTRSHFYKLTDVGKKVVVNLL